MVSGEQPSCKKIAIYEKTIPSRKASKVVLTFLYEECRTLVSCGWLLTNRKHGKKKKKGGGEGPESPHFIDGGHFDPLVDQARSH